MEKFQEKANKLLNDVVTRKRSRKIDVMQNQAKSGTFEVETNVTDIDQVISRCTYCTKAYKDSKYLVKHLFRRHTEKLVDLHKYLLTLSKSDSEAASSLLKMLTLFIEKEFKDLKSKLESVSQHLQIPESGHNVDNPPEQFSYFDKVIEDLNECETSDKKEKSSFESGALEIKELSLKCAETENAVKNLQEKLDDLLQIVKDNISFKADYDEKINMNEQNIILRQTEEISKLKSSLESELLEIKDVFQNHLYQQSFESRKQFSKLQYDFSREIQRLDKMVEVNAQKINSPESLTILERKFERQLKYFLKNKKPKRNSSRSRSLGFTCPEMPISSDMGAGEPRNVTNCKGIMKTTDFPSKITKRVNKELKNNPDIIQSATRELSYLVQDKLNSLNVAPKSNRIPCTQFDKKIRLVNCEKEILASKHDNFLNLREEIDSAANKMALSQVHKKNYKKITFSEPLSDREPLEKEKSKKIKSKIQNTRKNVEKQVSSGFIVSDYAKLEDLSHAKSTSLIAVDEATEQQEEETSYPIFFNSYLTIPGKDNTNSLSEINVTKSETSSLKDNACVTSFQNMISKDETNRALFNGINLTKSDASELKENAEEIDFKSSLESLSSWDEEDFHINLT